MDLTNLGLRPHCYAELFCGRSLPLGISSSPSSWSTEKCVVCMLWPEVESHIIFLRENQARVVARSYFALGWSYLFLRILPHVRLGPWFHIHRPTKIGFIQSLILRWSYRPRAPLGGCLLTFLSGFELFLQVMLDHLVHSLDLLIGLRLCDRWEDFLNLEVVTELFEFVTIKLCTIIGYNGVGDSVSVEDIYIDELLDLCGRDGHKRFCFNLFSEVVDSYYRVLYTTYPFGKLVKTAGTCRICRHTPCGPPLWLASSSLVLGPWARDCPQAWFPHVPLWISLMMYFSSEGVAHFKSSME